MALRQAVAHLSPTSYPLLQPATFQRRGAAGSSNDTSTTARQHDDSPATPSRPSGFSAELLDMLVCPLTKAPLRYDPERHVLISEQIGVAYPILDGVPQLTPTAGQVVDASKRQATPRVSLTGRRALVQGSEPARTSL